MLSAPWLAGGWDAAGAAAHPAFEGVAQMIEAGYADVESVVVVRDDRRLFEYYKAGGNENTLRDVQSVTKSVLSMAVGAALGQGALRSLDQPLPELWPGAEPPAGDTAALTIRHLLTMSAGFAPAQRFAAIGADDPSFLLRRERVAAPGARFAYDNLSVNLLSVALQAAVGRSSAAFARQQLFEPLEIRDFDWTAGAGGHSLGFSGLKLRSRDMAQLGQLMLRQGQWQGKPLLPQAYARASVTAQNAGGPPVNLPYGYLWWVVPSDGDTRTFFASGYGGQLIWVHVPLNLVIATTSVVSAGSQARGQALALVRTPLFRAAVSV